MAVTLFSDTTFTLAGLVDRIGRGEVALPDIQRPFVWKSAKVRDLFDSMYKGFPIGFLLFWETGAEPGARTIGLDDKEAPPSLLIVDGQQRLTSLYAVLTAAQIVRQDFSTGRIRIAFRPHDGQFEVADAAIDRDPEFISDISVLWSDGRKKSIREFLQKLEEHRGELTQDESDQLEDAIDRVHDLRNYPFKVVQLSSAVDEERVAEVFVRINSEGVTLNQADFILTLMSVWWDKGRRQLEDFARASRVPATAGPSPFNHFIRPDPDQLLRVAVGLGFRRGVLRHVYSILRGKDLETGEVSPERRIAQFETLESAQAYALDLVNWHEYLKCLAKAGFRGERMISSKNALLYTYVLYLIGQRDYGVPRAILRDLIGRWFFMAHTTGRYTSSPETRIEADIARFREVPAGDHVGFSRILSRIIDDTFTNDYWTIALPNDLDTSASKSPSLLAYFAALNILDAEVLFSDMKVSELVDPALATKKGVERHHLFPRKYLANIGVQGVARINSIANMALVEWWENIDISARSPSDYWPEYVERMDASKLERHAAWHALPDDWHTMSYDEFLDKRRHLIAGVVKQGYEALTSS